MKVYLRAETFANECRSPLAPEDVSKLINEGYTIHIEKSTSRAFRDEEFKNAGAHLTHAKWFDQDSSTLILGLKELDCLDRLNAHSHVYFSHCLKNQVGSDKILQAFKNSQSKLYDLEYFKNDTTRLVSFGFYAGLVGATIGLQQHYSKRVYNEDIIDLKPWLSINEMYDSIKVYPAYVAVIGNGRSSKGVQPILQKFGIVFDVIERDQTVVPYIYDIIFNCITLDESYNKVWLSPEYNHQKSLLVVDISCDYTKKNNPITVYDEATSWKRPVFNYKNISVIAIENLPSLLPRESSAYFSNKLTELLLNYGSKEWTSCLEIFTQQLSGI